MLRIGILSLVAALLIVGGSAQTSPNVATNAPSSTSQSNNTTTTTARPTTTKSNSTTTAPSNTTTVKPTTSPAPTTVSPYPPKPTIAPNPSAPNKTWDVTEKNVTCIHALFAAEMRIVYNYTNMTTNTNETVTVGFNIPASAEVDSEPGRSTCNNSHSQQVLSLAFSEGKIDGSLQLVFNTSNNRVFVAAVSVVVGINADLFPGLNQTKSGKLSLTAQLDASNALFSVSNGNSYACDDDKKVDLKETTKPIVISSELHFIHLKVQGFMKADPKNVNFGAETNCKLIVNNLVPIVVGVALAALVVIVLIAYFIGRRRSRRMAYQSV